MLSNPSRVPSNRPLVPRQLRSGALYLVLVANMSIGSLVKRIDGLRVLIGNELDQDFNTPGAPLLCHLCTRGGALRYIC